MLTFEHIFISNTHNPQTSVSLVLHKNAFSIIKEVIGFYIYEVKIKRNNVFKSSFYTCIIFFCNFVA